jgi:signal transduction histidine kinase
MKAGADRASGTPPKAGGGRGSFSRDVRLLAVGGLGLSLFLGWLASLVLGLVSSWGAREWEGRRVAEAHLVAERLQAMPAPAAELASPGRRTGQRLFESGAVAASLYDAAGARIANAEYLPRARSAPDRLPVVETPASSGSTELKRASEGALIVAVRAGPVTLRIAWRDPAAAAFHRSSWLVPALVLAGDALLLLLVFPFLRRLLRPIDALAETARSAGPIIEGREGTERPGGPEDDVAVFRKAIDELMVRTEEIERLRRQERETARRQLEALGEVSAGAAHEFRNAAAALLGWVRLAGSGPEADRERALAAARKEAENVAAIAGDFLEFARPESLRPSTFDLAEIAEIVVEEERRAAPDVEFALDALPTRLTADEVLLRRAISNLVRNAAEAAWEGGREGHVAVSVRPAPEGALVEVEDDGAGLPPGIETDRLFLPFVTTKEKGSGLGLAIVARVAVLHGGSVEAGASRTLGGARMSLRISAAPAEPSADGRGCNER